MNGKNKIKSILIKIYENPLFDILLLTFSGTMCLFAIALRNWIGVLITWYPVNLFIIYCFYRKKMSKVLQETLIFIISFCYLLYIWQPLSDGTISNAIREMTSIRWWYRNYTTIPVPTVSSLAEVDGALALPSIPFKARGHTDSLWNTVLIYKKLKFTA